MQPSYLIRFSNSHCFLTGTKKKSLKLQTRRKCGDTGAAHKIHMQAEIPISKEWKKNLARRENKEKMGHTTHTV